jgi:hypothetical protein
MSDASLLPFVQPSIRSFSVHVGERAFHSRSPVSALGWL